MSELPSLVKDLALILAVASIVTLLFKKLKQPLVLGYIMAGFLVSPHMPYTMSVMDKTDIQTWADIGVIFLLFAMGLDFSFKKILKLGTSPFIAVSTIFFSMLGLGYMAGRIFGWTHMECIFLASIFGVCSSTTIIYKTFTDLKLKQQKFTTLVLSVLVLEDVISIIIMVMLSAIAEGNSVDGGQFVGILFKIGFFIVLWFVVGIFFVPMLLRKVRKLLTNEILVIVSLGLCFVMAIVSSMVGFSSAFGAFVIGSILAETVEGTKIAKVVDPIKDLFGAVFFVSVGMLVNPDVLVAYAIPILVIVGAIILGQAIFGTMGFVLSGQSLKTAMRCSFSMAQIGEFPFIIASLGLSLGVIGNFLYPVIVAGSAITTFLTPYTIRASVPCHNFIEKHLPTKWLKALDRMTTGEERLASDSKWRSLITAMLRNTLIYSILTIATIVLMLTLFLPFAQHLMPQGWWANIVCGVLTFIIIAPFLRAIIAKKNHSEEFTYLWNAQRRNRLPLLFTILVRVMIVVGFVFYIFNRLSHFSMALIASIAMASIIPMWLSRGLKKRSIRMERLFVQNLRSKDIEAVVLGYNKPNFARNLRDRDVHISDIELPENSIWAGKTLKELNLGRRFGIHVSSILRGKQRINIPNGRTRLFPFDKIQAIGSDEQLTAFDTAVNDNLIPGDPDIEKREMDLHQLMIHSGDPFVGKTLQESGIRDKYNCMIVGVDEGQKNLSPIKPSHILTAGDILWIVGEKTDIDRLLSLQQA